MTDVVLLQMPFAQLSVPSLGLGLVSAALTGAGISNRVRYANIRFAERLGSRLYSCCEGFLCAHPISEWAFAGAAFPEFRPDSSALIADACARLPFAGQLVALAEFDTVEAMFEGMRQKAELFLDELVEQILAEQPRIVGCTSMFTQHVPSLALLRRIKARAPEVVTVMGGSSCAENMGRVTHRLFEWIDYLFLGEADGIVGPVFAALLRGGAAGLEGRPEMSGVLAPFDRGQPSAAAKRGQAAEELDSCAIPDHSAFLAELRGSIFAPAVAPGLLMEFSRGCWWAENKRCNFCGIEAFSRRQRGKSVKRIVDELRWLVERHGVDRVTVVDNMVDLATIRGVCAEVATWERRPKLFLETRPEISHRELELLSSAGCSWVQVGIERLDDESLTELHKGTTAARNIQILRWGRQTGVHIQWNWLYGLPGETEVRCERAAELVPLLAHLDGPENVGQLLFLRNGTYFEEPERWGLRLEPDPRYRQVYPFSEEDAGEFAYLFRRVDSPAAAQRGTPATRRLHEELDRWMLLSRSSRPPTLIARDTGTGLEIEDTRPVASSNRVTIGGWAREVCLCLSEAPGTQGQLAQRLQTSGAEGTTLGAVLEDLVRKQLIVKAGRWFVFLPVCAELGAQPRAPVPASAEAGLRMLELNDQ